MRARRSLLPVLLAVAALAACNRDLPAPADLASPDLTPPAIADCPALPALCTASVDGTYCRAAKDEPCTQLGGPHPLRCACDAAWNRWSCEDCRCFVPGPCPDDGLTCSSEGFEPSFCRCVFPEREWTCCAGGEVDSCCPTSLADNGQPCNYAPVYPGSHCSLPGFACYCEDHHWRCTATDGG